MTRLLGVFRGSRARLRTLRLGAGATLLFRGALAFGQPAPPAHPTPEAREPAAVAEPPPAAPAPVGPVPAEPASTTNAAPDAPVAKEETPPPAAPPPEPVRSEPPPSETTDEHAGIEEEGALKYELDGIEVRGNAKTRSRVVLRYVPFRPGDILDVDDARVELTRYRLLGTGFFRDVQLSLRKGKLRGHVVLIIEVVERNTLIVNDLWMGLAATANAAGQALPLTAYAGLDAAETNLAGTGMTLGAAAGIAHDQYALRLRFFNPALFLGGQWMTSGTLLFNHANDFFGNHDVGYAAPLQTLDSTVAVLQYERFGGTVGVGRDLSVSTQVWANYRLERLNAHVPLTANNTRGIGDEAQREPIDFYIQRDKSVLSTISATVQHDTRDKPILPTRGWFASVTTEVSLSPLGSDYPYARIDALASKWWTLPWEHVLRLRLFAGVISGRAPFFERYYVGDLSDFRAARVLGLNVERRLAPNFFHTDVGEVRYGDYAGKLDVEYRIPLYRGRRAVYGIDAFARAGFFMIAGQRDISQPPSGYSGAGLIPIDFTANFGIQLDTSAGGFTFAFANLLGFIPGLGQSR